MTAMAKTDDYLRILFGMGLASVLFQDRSNHRIPLFLCPVILLTPITIWMVAAGYRCLMKKFHDFLAFPVF